MLPTTFEMAFAGNRSELTERMDLTHGLLEKLLDRSIINRRHYQEIRVSRFVLCVAFVEQIGKIALSA